jgi:hypothetical protein
MARRTGSVPLRRVSEVAPFSPTSATPKARTSPWVSFCLLLMGALALIGYSYGNSVFQHTESTGINAGHNSARLLAVRSGDDISDSGTILSTWDGLRASSRPECSAPVCDVIPILLDMYGKTMHRLLHIGPGTCGVVSKLLKEGGSEAWGIQPFKMKEPVHKTCHNLLHKGFIRIADANRPLPYRSRSFSFVLVTDTLDVMKVRELNTTLNELSRLSAHSLVVIVSKHRHLQAVKMIAKPGKIIKPLKPRTRAWWLLRFQLLGLKEDEEKSKHFDAVIQEMGKKFSFYIFHLLVPSFSTG